MELIGEKRQKIGKAVKSLRKMGLIPAVIFGNEIESDSIVLNRMAFAKLFSKAGETSLVDLKIEDKSYKVLINDVQFDPVSDKIIHAGFYKPNLKEKTEVHVPVKVIGEEANPLIKSGEGVALQLMNEILVRALPSDLPEAFVIDVSLLTKVGDGVTVGELSFDKSKVEIIHLDADELVVKLDNAVMAQTAEDTAAEALSEQEAIEKLEALKEKKPEDETVETVEKE